MRIALLQLKPRKGDYAANVRRIGGALAQVGGWREPPDLVVLGETAMTGYFLEGGVGEHAVTAGTLFRDLTAAHAASGAPPLDICAGFYERHGGRVFNSALYASLGKEAVLRHVHRKVFLPTYGLFDEQRFVDPGTGIRAFDTAWGRTAILVCEDVWHATATAAAALDGARLILVPSASPARGPTPLGQGAPDSVVSWDRVIQRAAEEHGVYVVLAQIAGTEGGKTFQGCSTIVGPDGTILARGPAFDEAIVHAELDETAIQRARADQPLLADLEVAWPRLAPGAGRQAPGATGGEPQRPELEVGRMAAEHLAEVGAMPVGDPLVIDPDLLEQWLVRFLRDEFAARGFARAIVGVSGGVDSAVVLALAVRALGTDGVIAVSMPHETSSKESREHAALVAKHAGVPLHLVDITRAVEAYFAAADPDAGGHRRGNVMARVRMLTLFDLAHKHGALPLGTGNKSERLVGYFTWHGDDAPPINPIGDLFKTQVWALARYLAVPAVVVHKQSTADLVPGQTDEGDLGVPYAELDPILHWLLAGYARDEITALGFPPAAVDRVVALVSTTHWKRRLPTVAVISRQAIGESWLRPVDY